MTEENTSIIPISQFNEWTQVSGITDRHLTLDFRNLVKCKVDENPRLKMSGYKVIRRLFMRHLIKTKTKSGLSFYDAMHDETLRQKYTEISQRYRRTVYDAFSLHNGCVNYFRPAIAKWIYARYGAKEGVMDFSAGWGGRCLASMALGIPYYGVDTNVSLRETYDEMIRDYNPHKVRVEMTWQPAETADFRGKHYDLILTSPPYYTLERYPNMPEYTSADDFYARFLVPVVVKAFKYLRVGGHMCLNMPEDMYEAVKESLPPLLEVVPYLKRNRNAALKDGKKKPAESENIYVWKKTAPPSVDINVPGATKRVEIHESPVHGLGVFAKGYIPSGYGLAPFHGVEMSKADFKLKYGKDTRRSYDLGRLNKMIDGKDFVNLSHYCNESDTPNVALRKRGLYTLRHIAPGEELFLKYPKNYPRDYIL